MVIQCNIQKQPPEVFYKKTCSEKFHKIHRKAPAPVFFLVKFIKTFIKKEARAQAFSCQFCENFQNTFFTEHLWTTASEHCFRDWLYILINTFHILYIKFHHRNVIFFLFSFRFSRIWLFFTSNDLWVADLALKLSKSFNKNREIYRATQAKSKKML